jgi:hypothetical protein
MGGAFFIGAYDRFHASAGVFPGVLRHFVVSPNVTVKVNFHAPKLIGAAAR